MSKDRAKIAASVALQVVGLDFAAPRYLGTYVRPPGPALVEGRLLWTPSDDSGVWVKPGRELLARFTALANARPERVQEFAAKWGPLGLCAHGELDRHVAGSCPPGEDAAGSYERVEDWQRWSRRAAALVRLCVARMQRKPGARADWADLFPEDGCGLNGVTAGQIVRKMAKDARENEPLLYGQAALALLVTHWLRDSGVRLGMEWAGDRPVLYYEASSLAAIVGLQLLTTLGAADGLTTCYNCGREFIPARRGGNGTRRYCPDCGRAASNRDADRNYKKRRKDQRAEQRAQENERAARLAEGLPVLPPLPPMPLSLPPTWRPAPPPAGGRDPNFDPKTDPKPAVRHGRRRTGTDKTGGA